MSTSKIDKTGNATKWNAISLFFKQGLRLSSNLILTRLLSPEIFGLMALVNMIMQALTMLSDIGLRPSLIRSQREDDDFLLTAWTLQVVRGVVIWLIVCAVAWPASIFFNQESLSYILPISGLIALFMGFNSIAIVLAQKHLNYKRITLFEITTSVLGLLLMTTLAYEYRNVWSLVIGGVFTTALMTVFSFIFLPSIKHRFRWDPGTVRELFHFGKWVFLSTALAFFVMQFDKIALGKLATIEALGLYSIAMVWASIPKLIVDQLANRIFFPVIAELYRNNKLDEIKILRKEILVITSIIAIFLIVTGKNIIELMYTTDYVGAGIILVILGALAWFETIDSLNTQILLTIGRPKDKIISQLVSLLIFSILIVPAFNYLSVMGVALLAVFTVMVRAFINNFQLLKHGFHLINTDLLLSSVVIIAGGSINIFIEKSFKEANSLLILALYSIFSAILFVFIFSKQQFIRKILFKK